MRAGLLAMCALTFTRKSITAQVAGGGETLGSSSTFVGYLEAVTERVRTDLGLDRSVKHLLITPTAITEDERIWLPGADTSDVSASLRPVHINPMYEPRSTTVSHYEVYL